MSLNRLYRKSLKSLKPYQAIQPPGAVKGDALGGEVIKLDGNENVYGCSPRVQEALRRLGTYHIYPDPEQRALRKALEGYTGVDARHILAGAGSDEIIDMLLRLTIDPGDKVINSTPTFGMYSYSTELAGGAVVTVPRGSKYEVDMKRVLSSIDQRTKIVFLATPNNPTGNTTPRADILRLLESDSLVVIDEAYYEFSGLTAAHLVPEHENLVVLRTFSKWAGLAGLRVGYGMMSPELVERLMVIKQPYNINTAAEVAAIVSIEEKVHLMGTVSAIVAERDRLFGLLRGVSYLQPAPSEANFILCRVEGKNARDIHAGLRRRGIFIRHFDTPQLSDCIRISVGKPEHSEALLQALRGWE